MYTPLRPFFFLVFLFLLFCFFFFFLLFFFSLSFSLSFLGCSKSKKCDWPQLPHDFHTELLCKKNVFGRVVGVPRPSGSLNSKILKFLLFFSHFLFISSFFHFFHFPLFLFHRLKVSTIGQGNAGGWDLKQFVGEINSSM